MLLDSQAEGEHQPGDNFGGYFDLSDEEEEEEEESVEAMTLKEVKEGKKI